ncbi:MAG TPA: glycosyltransferase family 87 protein, partial [Anaerolineales bacterium]|nr:glycosyltransferase family 87 protein [Anaerolineales bacterium]
MNAEQTRWMNRLDFAMLTTWLMLSFILAIISFVLFGQDFRGYYAAARVLISGGNPYDYQLVAQVLLEVTGEMGNNPYYYPPWFSWLFIPLVFLPFQIARAIWMTLNVILWNLGLWHLGKFMAWPSPGWRRHTLFALATFSFAWITWRYEQAGILVFFMLVELILSIHGQKWIRAGIWMALLLVKPNITLIVVAGISLWLLRKGHWRPVLVMLLTLVILLSISTAITPSWFEPFTEEGFGRGLTVALDGPDEVVAIRINTTFLDWLRTLGIELPWNILLYGIAICIGIIVYFWNVYRS